MDDTQRLRIYRPDEDEHVLNPSRGNAETSNSDGIAIRTEITDETSSTDLRASAIDAVSEIPAGSGGLLTQANGLLRRFLLFTGYSLAACLLTGCTAFHPLHGIPVRQLPLEFRGPSRANMETIDLTRLSQTPQLAHIVDSGDLLGVYIYGILGKIDETPPVYVPQNGDGNPTIGLPIPVRDDGTISLPQIPPLYVRGMTVRQTEEAVRREYVQRGIREDGTDILVSLQRARSYKVTVLRQEGSNPPITGLAGGGIQLGASKRGTGQIVILPAGSNDVLRALTMSGGLPGLDAQNAIYVLRRPRPVRQVPLASILHRTESWSMPPLSNAPIVLASQKSGFESPFKWMTRKSHPASGGLTLVGFSEPTMESTEIETPQRFMQVDGQNSAVAPWIQQTNLPQFSMGRSTASGYRPAATSAMPLAPTAQGEGYRGSGYSLPIPTGLGGNQHWSEPIAEQLPQPLAVPDSTATIDRPYDQPDPNLNAPTQMPIVANGNQHIPAELQPYAMAGGQVFRIPVRLHPGEQAYFNENDILLFDGDIVFIESRETEIFYTGGLLGGGQFSLPQAYDLDVLEAISIAQGRGTSGGGSNHIGGIASLNQDISVSASRLIVIRRLADGRRVNIKIDINKALRDENENLLVQPGDHLILRYTPLEAIGAFIERNLLAGSLIGVATQTSTLGQGK